MAYGEIQGNTDPIWDQPNTDGEEGYVWTQQVDLDMVPSRNSLYIGFGILAGIGLGVLAWAIGDNRLDACATVNCLADSVNIHGINSPFSGEDLPVLIRSFGLGN